MRKVSLAVLCFCSVGFPAAFVEGAALTAETSISVDGAATTDTQTGVTGTVYSSVSFNAEASVSDGGAAAVYAFYNNWQPFDYRHTAVSTWSDSFVSSDSGKVYRLQLRIAAGELLVQDWTANANTEVSATYNIDVKLNGQSIWNSSATLSGNAYGVSLTENGQSLGGGFEDYPQSSSFWYVFDAYETALTLGTFPSGQAFTLDYTIRAEVSGPGFESGAMVSFGNAQDLLNAPGLVAELAAPKIVVTPVTHDFGPLLNGLHRSHEFTVSNEGTADLEVWNMAFSEAENYAIDVTGGINPCGTVTPVIIPGENCTVIVALNPIAEGNLSTVLTVSSNDPKNPATEVQISGVGTIPWAKAYGGIEAGAAYDIQETAEAGYVVAGNKGFNLIFSDRGWVLKLSINGEIEWQKGYQEPWDPVLQVRYRFFSIKQTGDDGYVAIGHRMSQPPSMSDQKHPWIMKVDGVGNIAWQKEFQTGNDWTYLVAGERAADGGYLVAADLGGDFLVVKIDGNGNFVSGKTFHLSELDQVIFLRATGDGGYIVGGYTGTLSMGAKDAWVMKLDSEHNVEWQKRYGREDFDEEAHSILQTPDGGYIVAGEAHVPRNLGIAYRDVWLLKLDSGGNIQWQYAYGGSEKEERPAIAPAEDGGYLVTAMTRSFGAGEEDVWLFKVNDQGVLQWQKTYGSSASEQPAAIRPTRDGGFVVGGQTTMYGRYDVLVMKVDPEGVIEDCAGLLIQPSTATPVETDAIAMDVSFSETPYTVTLSPGSAGMEPTHEGRYTVCGVLEEEPSEMGVKINGRDIVGDGRYYSLARAILGLGRDYVFTIENTGNGDLHLTGTPKIAIGGGHPEAFTVISEPVTPVPPGGSTTFVIRFTPVELWLIWSATVSIASNDLDENPYHFSIQSAAVPPDQFTDVPQDHWAYDAIMELFCARDHGRMRSRDFLPRRPHYPGPDCRVH